MIHAVSGHCRKIFVASLASASTLLLSGCLNSAPTSPESSNALQQITASQAESMAVAAVKNPNPLEQVMAHTPDLWDRLRDGMRLGSFHQPRVEQELDWFKRNPDYVGRVVERARPYLHFIVEEVERRNMPMEIALLPVVESAFQPFAYSHGRAAGLWQFIPSTGKLYGLKQNWWYDGRRDVYASTRAALNYLQRLNKKFDGDWLLALAAYNSGEYNVQRAIRKNRAKGKPVDFFSLKLPKETERYAPKLLAIAQLVRQPADHGITLNSIDNEPYFERVTLDSQIDLALAADLADLSIDDMYALNPGFNRWATDPDGPHYLLLPIEKAGKFKVGLATLPKEKRVRWVRHKIKSGETLGEIAAHYHTTKSVIREANNLHGNLIRAGKSLTIPVATRSLSRYSKSAEVRRETKQHTPRDGRKIFHTVKRGDTMWDIARDYDVSTRKLSKWNDMAPGDTLRVDQQLVVWTKAKAVKVAHTTSLPRNQIMRNIRYTVRKGDSLARIATKFNVTIAQLRRWNSHIVGKYLQPGQRLKLIVDVTGQL